MFKKFLEKTFKYGTLEVIDYDGKKYIFGNSEPFTSIRFHKKDIKKKIIFKSRTLFRRSIC